MKCDGNEMMTPRVKLRPLERKHLLTVSGQAAYIASARVLKLNSTK